MATLTKEEIGEFSDEKLQRKLDQAYEMAGLARQDGDTLDASRHMTDAQNIRQEMFDRGL